METGGRSGDGGRRACGTTDGSRTGGYEIEVDFDRVRLSTGFSFSLSLPLNDGPASGMAGGKRNSSPSSGKRWIAKLGVDVLRFKPFLPGVSMGEGIKLGEGEGGPFPFEVVPEYDDFVW